MDICMKAKATESWAWNKRGVMSFVISTATTRIPGKTSQLSWWLWEDPMQDLEDALRELTLACIRVGAEIWGQKQRVQEKQGRPHNEMTLWWALGWSQGGETNWRSLKSSDKNSSYILRGRVDCECSLRLGDGAEDRRSGIFQRLA